jgi:hypothetical protein
LDWKRKLPVSNVHCLREKLPNTAVVISKLNRHFTTNHCHVSNKKTLLPTTSGFKKQKSEVFEKKVTITEKVQEASYLAAELIAQK